VNKIHHLKNKGLLIKIGLKSILPILFSVIKFQIETEYDKRHLPVKAIE